jgi:hypothetical protein
MMVPGIQDVPFHSEGDLFMGDTPVGCGVFTQTMLAADMNILNIHCAKRGVN